MAAPDLRCYMDLTYERIAAFIPTIATTFAAHSSFIPLLADEFDVKDFPAALFTIYKDDKVKVAHHLLLYSLHIIRDTDTYVTRLHHCISLSGRLTTYKLLLQLHDVFDVFAPSALQLPGLVL